jgi:hypothetical protein
MSMRPVAFAISVGVAKKNVKLRDQLDRELQRRAADVKGLLAAYHVPLVAAG